MQFLADSQKKAPNNRWLLMFYDLVIYLIFCLLLLYLPIGGLNLSFLNASIHTIVFGCVVFAARILFGVYIQIWRYGGIQSYFRLLVSDAIAFILYFPIQILFLPAKIQFIRCLALASMNLLGVLGARMFYRYVYKCCDRDIWYSKLLFKLFRILGASNLQIDDQSVQKIRVAIIGAGRIGNALADELLSSIVAPYNPVLFIDNSKNKVGREIHGIPVLAEESITSDDLSSFEVQEVILAVQQLTADHKKKLYEKYKSLGCKVKVYDYPVMETAGKRSVREFDIEELLFRKPINIESPKAIEYYNGKRILITGGGGSIGSEICRQLAKMSPEQLIILDIYENGAYDIQQELKIRYGNKIKVNIEIASVTDRAALERAFSEYRPQIVIMAAAHKHVPLMEKNCIEAVKNNVFGTLNTVETSEAFGVERVILVSTDKAVNPTNVMGATKRMCEMIVQTHSASGSRTTFSATRFGNVLGSAGSVIPLFKKQISHGGPVTITDKRIIRYFMTIPEASQLVLLSGAMANNGELFVLDMGKPVKIYDLAQSMIRLSGVDGIEIIETGLRPGEKLYEELLIKSESLQKTDNELIFIENDTPIDQDDLAARLNSLKVACDSNSDELVRVSLKKAVPSFVETKEKKIEMVYNTREGQ